MFHIYSVAGREFAGSLEQLRQSTAVSAVAALRRASAVARGEDAPASALGEAPAGTPRGAAALAAYGAIAHHPERQPLTRVADVMRRPAHTLPARLSVRDAWRRLQQLRISQAPVVDEAGALVGLAGRAELLPPGIVDGMATDPTRWLGLLDQPVAQVMWSPIVSAAPDTDLRRLAALLLDTGLPGLPVTDEPGQVIGFVSRSDLLRAMTNDPPLDVWG
jgi:CBS domain-containing protein